MPEIDRRLTGGSRNSSTDRRPKDRVILLVLTVLTLSLLLGAFSLMSRTDSSSWNPSRPVGIAYVTHAPITIEGDAGFLADNSSTGISWGSGTASDPYVIEGWEIAGVDDYRNAAVWVGGSNVHFVIQGCEIRDAYGDFKYGVYLQECTNGTVKDSVLYNNNYAILLETEYTDERLSNHRVINNTCTDNNYGIMAHYVRGIEISNNTCTDNEIGILCAMTSYDLVANNTCTDNICGLSILVAQGDDVAGNNCSSNSGSGIYVFKISGNNLRNNTCSDNDFGIWFGDADWEGGSDENLIHSNWIEGNTACGMAIGTGNQNNLIWNNSFVGNNGSGAAYDPERVQAIDNGTVNWWNTTDGYGNYWSDWTSPDENLDEIVDSPYQVNGTAEAMDYYPKASAPEAIPEFSSSIVVVTVLTATIGVMAMARRLRAGH